jgi:membrane protein
MKNIWHKILRENPHLEAWDEWMRTFTLPGLDGVAVYDISRFFNAEMKRNSLTIRSRAIAYSFFLALFPAILFIFSLVPFVLSFYDPAHVNNYIAGLVRSVSPSPDVFKFLWNLIGPVVREFTHKRPSLLTSTFVLTLFLASNGVVAMMSSFDKTYDDYHKRNALMTRLVALKISILLVMLFIFSIGLVVLGQNLLEWLFALLQIHDKFVRIIFTFIRFVTIVLLFFFSISLIYYYGPATKKKYRFISTGSTIATVLSILTSIVFSYYLNHYARYNKLYGPIGTVLAILIWLNLNAFVLLIGYEINVAIYYHRSIKQKHTGDEHKS